MSTLAEFIQELSLKAGIQADDARLKEIVTNASVLKIEVPPDLESEFNSNLHSIESAKSSRAVRDAMKMQILGFVDKDIETIIEEEGFDDTIKEELNKEKYTGKKIKLLATKIKELESAKSKAATGDKAEFTKTINDLKATLSSQTAAHNDAINNIKKTHEGELTNFMIKNQLSSYQYGLGVEPDVALTTAQALIDKQLLSKQAKLVNQNGVLSIISVDGTKYFNEKNIEVSAKDFIEGAIQPILKKSDAKPASTHNGFQQQPQPTINNGDGRIVNESALEQIQNQMKQFVTSK